MALSRLDLSRPSGVTEHPGHPGTTRLRARARPLVMAVVMVCVISTTAPPAALAQDSNAVRAAPVGLTLPMVVQSAGRAHPLVLAAEGRLRAARGGRRSAGTIANPVLTWQVENAAFPGRSAPLNLPKETSTYATLPLEPLWQRGARVGAANGIVQAAEADLIMTRRMVTLEAARAYHRAALAQASVAASSDVVVGLDSLVRYTGTRAREGAAAAGDVLRLQVERDRVSTDRALQEAELAQARAALQPYLTGATTAAELALDELHFTDPVQTATPSTSAVAGIGGLPPRAALASSALAGRPDLMAARARARAATSDVVLQRTLTVRQLGATFGSKRSAGTSTMIAGLSIPLPLFDRNRGEVERARGESIAAEQEVRWAERRASAEVLGAFDAATILTKQVDALQRDFLARAEESRRVALAAYREGAVPLLQVLDATRTLADARLAFYRARYAQQDAVLALHVAAGLDPAKALLTTAPTRGIDP